MTTLANNFQNIFSDKLFITPRVCEMLGKSPEQLAKMGLHEFASLVYDKGYEVSVSSWDAGDGTPGKLTITTDESQQAEAASGP